MPTTYTDLIASARRETREVSLDELKRRLDAREPVTLLDVREKEEYRTGFIPQRSSRTAGMSFRIETAIVCAAPRSTSTNHDAGDNARCAGSSAMS